VTSTDHPQSASVRILERAESLELLGTAQIGQLVFTYQAMPDVFPVNVAVADDVLLIPFADGSMIERAARNTVVAFHADKIDEATHLGWSVTVVGRSFEVQQADTLADRPTSWMPGRHDRMLAVALERVTGRAIEPGVK
jgi:uncharacterized protein